MSKRCKKRAQGPDQHTKPSITLKQRQGQKTKGRPTLAKCSSGSKSARETATIPQRQGNGSKRGNAKEAQRKKKSSSSLGGQRWAMGPSPSKKRTRFQRRGKEQGRKKKGGETKKPAIDNRQTRRKVFLERSQGGELPETGQKTERQRGKWIT